MKYKTLTLGAYQTNVYLVWDEETRQCAVIDPGYEPETILAAIRREGLTPAMILLTHAHFDHVGAVQGLVEALRIPVWLCEKDLAMPPHVTRGPLYYTDTYAEGDEISLGASVTFRVLETPGHTPGSVCLLCGDVMFSGDTLFAGSCGATHFPLGSEADMLASLRRLRALSENYLVLPGHGIFTTLAEEQRSNPYMKLA